MFEQAARMDVVKLLQWLKSSSAFRSSSSSACKTLYHRHTAGCCNGSLHSSLPVHHQQNNHVFNNLYVHRLVTMTSRYKGSLTSACAASSAKQPALQAGSQHSCLWVRTALLSQRPCNFAQVQSTLGQGSLLPRYHFQATPFSNYGNQHNFCQAMAACSSQPFAGAYSTLIKAAPAGTVLQSRKSKQILGCLLRMYSLPANNHLAVRSNKLTLPCSLGQCRATPARSFVWPAVRGQRHQTNLSTKQQPWHKTSIVGSTKLQRKEVQKTKAEMAKEAQGKSMQAAVKGLTLVGAGLYVYFAVLPPEVTDQAYVEFSVNNQPAGRVVIDLYGNRSPDATRNFKALVEHQTGFGYKGCAVHFIHKGFAIMTGDFIRGDGSAGASGLHSQTAIAIPFYRWFSTLPFGRGSVVLNRTKEGTVDSRFFFMLQTMAQSTTDFCEQGVVFGKVSEGMEVLDELSSLPVDMLHRPLQQITISGCGLLPRSL